MSAEVNQIRNVLPREISLLLNCARTEVDGETAERIRETAGQRLDWDRLIQTALTNGLMPLLYESLKAHAGDVMPPDSLNKLKDLFQKNTARTLLLTGELFRILDLFVAQGIEAMPYKGPAVAVLVYGRLSLRQFVDLDILVRKRDVWHCQQILIGAGYQPHFDITERQLPAFLKLGYVQMFMRDRGQSVVELHWGIASRFFSFPLDTDRFWDRLHYVDLMGHKVLSPSTEDLLLILCVHGAKDIWERLEWICAIAELLRAHDEIDWEVLRRNAKELGVERIVLLGLCLAGNLFGVRLPEAVARDIEAQSAIARLAAEVQESVLRMDPQSPGLRQRILFHLRTRERMSDRLRYCVRLLFTTTPIDWQTVPLPASMSFLYAFLRPFRLAKKYAVNHSKSLPSS